MYRYVEIYVNFGGILLSKTFRIVEQPPVVITDELYKQIRYDYINSDLKVEEIKRKYNLSHIDWKNLSKQFREELGVKCRPKKGCKYYYRISKDKWKIIKWIDGKLIQLGTIVCKEPQLKSVIDECKSVNWDKKLCKDIIRRWNYEFNRRK